MTKLALACLAAAALSAPVRGAAAAASPPPASAQPVPGVHHRPSTRRGFKVSDQARDHFRAAWGVDALRVSRVASGNLIRFNYRVVDPAQAAPLVDRKATPILVAPRAHATLAVPVMDKIGPLRQVATLKAGQEYWITFSNKGNLVRAGDRVNVIVGAFHADGLLVE